ncbi:MAG: FAD:protein FMN transferase, partial [Gammaproteobacteria bacterium]
RSGWPVDGFASVSVIADQCIVAGTATTVALLKGVDEGRRWLEGLGLPWLAVHRDGRIERRA